ncbi:hypothetical protein I4U23_016655 [Adineta vaga]|nr:hypothetical protein I4U23_016655 [Adineta vaga]
MAEPSNGAYMFFIILTVVMGCSIRDSIQYTFNRIKNAITGTSENNSDYTNINQSNRDIRSHENIDY